MQSHPDTPVKPLSHTPHLLDFLGDCMQNNSSKLMGYLPIQISSKLKMSRIQIISMLLTFSSVLCTGALCLAFLQIIIKFIIIIIIYWKLSTMKKKKSPRFRAPAIVHGKIGIMRIKDLGYNVPVHLIIIKQSILHCKLITNTFANMLS